LCRSMLAIAKVPTYCLVQCTFYLMDDSFRKSRKGGDRRPASSGVCIGRILEQWAEI
jgi:hypothetical protein